MTNDGQRRIGIFPPGFDLGRCHSIRELEVSQGRHGTCIRLLIEYFDGSTVVIVARDVLEMPQFRPAAENGVLPYTPFDLGELLISDQGEKVVLYDELKGWRIAAKFLDFETR